MQDIDVCQLIEKRSIIIMVGAGGVGKTSCSIGLAIYAARKGKKVGLLSIDPAKRLAKALGLELGGDLKPICFGRDRELKGCVDAAMLDQKQVFDSMVKKFASDQSSVDHIISHPLYISASTRLSGVGEYMALAKLQNMIHSKKYDLIILDTPPDVHALDFLSKPNILSGFVENRVMNWLIKPFHLTKRMGSKKLLNVGEKLLGGVGKVTGLAALGVLAEFLILMQNVIEGFNQLGEELVLTLKNKNTGFLLVTSCHSGSVRSSKYLSKKLFELGYNLDGVVFNKCLPNYFESDLLDYMDHSESKSHSDRHIIKVMQNIHSTQKESIDKILNDLKLLKYLDPKYVKISQRLQNIHSLDDIYDFSLAFDA